ncbi:MAG TPA: hypothetical protein VKY74_16135 [Chloroflexia bacterium]|nr:hypothetical protein [Chloroflexia bacterium]
MGRLTPLGRFLVLALFLIVMVGVLSATNNLRWPPFGISLLAPPLATPSGAAGAPTAPAAESTGPAASPRATLPAPSNTPPAPGTPAPAQPTAPPAPTRTLVPPSPTPVPPGLAYVGAIDIAGAVAGPAGAQPAVVDPDAHRLYVVSLDAQHHAALSAYDETTLARQGTVALDLGGLVLDTLAPVPVVIAGPTHRLYVVARDGRVVSFDSGTLAPGPIYNFGQPAERAFLSPDSSKLYGLQRDQPGSTGALLRVLDFRAVTSRPLRVPARWTGDSAFTDGNTLYLTGRDGLLPLDMRTDRFGAPLLLGFAPLFPLFDPAGRRLYTWQQPQAVPLTPELVILDANTWQPVTSGTHAGCPCPLAYNAPRGRLYLGVSGAPGRLLTYSPPDKLGAPEELVLNTVPALGIVASPDSNRLYVQSSGPHTILVLQDNGPAPGSGPKTVTIGP